MKKTLMMILVLSLSAGMAFAQDDAPERNISAGLNVGQGMLLISDLDYETGMGFAINAALNNQFVFGPVAVNPGLKIGQYSLDKGSGSEGFVEVAVVANVQYDLEMVTPGLWVSGAVGGGMFDGIGLLVGLDVGYELTDLVGQPLFAGLKIQHRKYTDDNETVTDVSEIGIQLGYRLPF